MPCSYFIDTDRRVVFMRAWGTLTDPELHARLQALQSDSRFDVTYPRISDFRDVRGIALTADAVRAAGQTFAGQSVARRATIVASELAFGLTRMSQLAADSSPGSWIVSRDLPSAMEWVGLPATTEWPAAAPHFVVDQTPGSDLPVTT